MTDFNAIWLLAGIIIGSSTVILTGWLAVKFCLKHLIGTDSPVIFKENYEIADEAGEYEDQGDNDND